MKKGNGPSKDFKVVIKKSKSAKMVKKELPKEVKAIDLISKTNKIASLLKSLNDPETKCVFWVDSAHFLGDIMGIRPVKRKTVYSNTENKFSLHQEEREETFPIFYVIDVAQKQSESILNKKEEEKKRFIEDKGGIYIKSDKINLIYEQIRRST